MFALDPVTPDFAARYFMAGCFLLATVGAVLAGRPLVAGAMGLASVEAIANWRFKFHEAMEPLFESAFPGWSHFEIQSVLLALVTLIALMSGPFVIRTLRGARWWRRILIVSLLSILGMEAIEIISRDDMARVLYKPIGPFFFFVWWMAISALLVAIACVGESQISGRSRIKL